MGISFGSGGSGGGVKFGYTPPSSSSSFNQEEDDLQRLLREIENSKFRLQNSGAEKMDSRNGLEKFFNLPEKQNVFFDILDVIERPLQGVKNTAHAFLNDRDDRGLGEAFWDGFSGQEKVKGSQIMGDLGFNSKLAKGVGGFALDVGLDPITYVPGGVFAKGGKAVLNGGKKLIPTAVKNSDIVKGLGEVKDGLGRMFDRKYDMKYDLDGNKIDENGNPFTDLMDIDQQVRNDEKFRHNEVFEDIVGTKIRSKELDPTLIGRTMEDPLKQTFDVSGYTLPNGQAVENFDEVKSFKDATHQDLSTKGEEYKLNQKLFQRQESDLQNQIAHLKKEQDKIFYTHERGVKEGVTKQIREKETELTNLQQSFRQEEDTLFGLHNEAMKKKDDLYKEHEGTVIKETQEKVKGYQKEYQRIQKNQLNQQKKTDGELKAIQKEMDKLYFALEKQAKFKRAFDKQRGLIPYKRKYTPQELQDDTFDLLTNSQAYKDLQVRKADLEDTLRKLGEESTEQLNHLSFLMKTIDEDIQSLKGTNPNNGLTDEAMKRLSQDPRYADIDHDLNYLAKERDGLDLRKMDELNRAKQMLDSSKTSLDNLAKGTPDENLLNQTMDIFSNDPKKLELDQQMSGLMKLLEDIQGNATKETARKMGEIKQGINTLNQAKEIRKTKPDAVITKPHERTPVGEVPNDPKYQETADELARIMSDYTKRVEAEQGIRMPDGEGYMPHILTDKAREDKLRQGSKQYVSSSDKGFLKSREELGSAEEVNQKRGKELFETDPFKAVLKGEHRRASYVAAETLKRKILANEKLARPLKEGDLINPKTQAVIDINDFDFMRRDADGNLLPKKKDGTKFVVTKGAHQLLEQAKVKMSDDGINAFLKSYDAMMNGWKKIALFSVGYHVRNDVGANFNMYIGGMRPDQIASFKAKAVKDIIDAKKIIKKKQHQGIDSLTDKEKHILANYDQFRKEGLIDASAYHKEFVFGDTEKLLVRKVNQQTEKKGVIKNRRTPFEYSRDVGSSVDELNRYATYQWALKKFGGDSKKAANLTRDIHFDYEDLSSFEKNVGKRLMPFYTWIRKNLEFQLKSFVNKPSRHLNVEKARQMLFELTGIEEENIADYQRDSQALPVYGDGQGNGFLASLNLPNSDLIHASSNPTKVFTDALSPFLKVPVELGTNTNLFTGKDIKEFEGQKEKFLGMELDPETIHIINQLGAVRNLNRNMGNAQEKDVVSLVSGNIVKSHDAEKAEFFRLLDEAKQLEEQMKLYEQQNGRRPYTIDELKEMGITREEDQKQKKYNGFNFRF